MNPIQTFLLVGAVVVAGFLVYVLLNNPFDTKASSRVFFIEPKDGEIVSNPVQLKWDADNFVIEPAGEFREDAGHLHIIIDSPCVSAGEVIPSDESHIHFGGGQTQTEMVLPSGERRLCLQMGDGLHRALTLTQEITITVQ